MQNFSFEPAPN